jgi:hypothetical protein
MRTCFLHIGTHKTGTTSIQTALAQHAETLDKSGYIYPRTGRSESSVAHHNIAFSLFERDRFQAKFGDVDELLMEMRSSSKNIIISSEEFVRVIHYNKAAFQQFVDNIAVFCHKTIIILYVRRQTDFLKSNYFERLKSGFSLTFEDYVTQRLDSDLSEFPLDYARLISDVGQVTGTAIVVRSYDAVRAEGLVADFFGLLGISPDNLQKNPRLNVQQSFNEAFLSYYQNRMGRIATDAERQIIMALMEALSTDNLRMAEPTRAVVTQRFEQSNKDIAARFGLSELGVDDLQTNPGLLGVVIDHIFSSELPEIVRLFADQQERLNRTDEALAQVQTMAFDRYREIKRLEEQLGHTATALDEARTIAFDRFREIERLEEQLSGRQ